MSGRFSRSVWAWARRHRALLTAPLVVGGAYFSWQEHTPKNPHMPRFPTVSAKEAAAKNNASKTEDKFPHLDPHSMNFPRSKWDHNWDQREGRKAAEGGEGSEGEDEGKECKRAGENESFTGVWYFVHQWVFIWGHN